MSPFDKLLYVAASLVERDSLSLSLRVYSLLNKCAREDRTDTDRLLDDSLQEERSDEPPIEVVDTDDTDDTDEDVEALFPLGALPIKERRQGPHPKDVGVAKPDWWNP